MVMNRGLAKTLKVLPPVVVLVLLLYFNYRVGQGADKLLEKKAELEAQKKEEVAVVPATEGEGEQDVKPPVPVEPEQKGKEEEKVEGDAEGGKPVEAVADAVLEEEPEVRYSDVFGGEFWTAELPEQWMRRFVRVLDDVSNGNVPKSGLGDWRSEVAFSGELREGVWYVSSATKQRYGNYVDAICGLDLTLGMKLYRLLIPALDGFVKELGYGDKDCTSLFEAALSEIADMPLPTSEPGMEHVDGSIYQWIDPELEKQSQVRKFCMRLGYENAVKLRDKAVEARNLLKKDK